MTLVPLTTCCLSLGIDPKTLRLWLKAAHISCCLHPADARLKCLTLPQLQQLADLHGRHLPSALPTAALASLASPQAAPASDPGGSAPGPRLAETELCQQLNVLRQQVSTLQAQVTELALALLRMSPAPPVVSASPIPPLAPPICTSGTDTPAAHRTTAPRSVVSQTELTRTRSRALPLIQVRSDRSVVVIAPTEGVLGLVPDSPDWFAWLSCIEAFSFESPSGRFSATRKFRQGLRIQSWNVHRSLHGRSCTLYLGLTPTLTLARLQEMATIVHLRLTAL